MRLVLSNLPWLPKYLNNETSQLSGVARVTCALGQEIFLRPPSTKLTEFEVKNW